MNFINEHTHTHTVKKMYMTQNVGVIVFGPQQLRHVHIQHQTHPQTNTKLHFCYYRSVYFVMLVNYRISSHGYGKYY